MIKKIKKILPLSILAMTLSQPAFAQWNTSNYDSTKLPKTALYSIIENTTKWLLSVFGFIAIIGFVLSGIMYLLAAGDEKTQERAKRAMIYSIVGVVVGLGGLVVIYAVNFFLSQG
ncbi:MAG: TrbC/VirB2 family protein [Candidatus Moranbacteria bacterium]|nr:TrbC/VirB2 family protein [Candidatus Moranbacteria bacterium]